MAIRVTFWGVRGSIPTPGPTTVRYGGNTACLELRFGAQEKLIIIDAGSGIRELAGEILKKDLKKGPIDTKIFLTHTHWDHIMGFPFFTPIYMKGAKLEVYGPVSFEDEGLDSVVGGQLQYRYFPVNMGQLEADIQYIRLMELTKDLGDGIRMTTKYLNHPITVLGYRFEYQGKIFCTAYDHEPYRNIFDVPKDDPSYVEAAVTEGAQAAKEENEKVQEFFRGADLLVHDTQYTQKEYEAGKRGWGHSSFEWAIKSAHKAGVKRLILFHHDPDRSDDKLEELYGGYLAKIKGKTKMVVALAKEGETIEV
ncbi:MAG TPA: MBL fold metallo-hydrolase [Spirochaetia bacterium]|nr:MBL fold metallo-hydrolase [Spirochaetia bacterium]